MLEPHSVLLLWFLIWPFEGDITHFSRRTSSLEKSQAAVACVIRSTATENLRHHFSTVCSNRAHPSYCLSLLFCDSTTCNASTLSWSHPHKRKPRSAHPSKVGFNHLFSLFGKPLTICFVLTSIFDIKSNLQTPPSIPKYFFAGDLANNGSICC